MSARGDWFVTASGRRMYVFDPDISDIVIEDIAAALSKLCRFGGHVREFYSVAQHSYIVASLVPERLALAGLLHDASEAYLGDVIRPLKGCLGEYRLIEAEWERAIAERFGLDWLTPADGETIKRADLIALATERRDLLPFADPGKAPDAWRWEHDELSIEPHGDVSIVPVSPRTAELAFLERFRALYQEAA